MFSLRQADGNVVGSQESQYKEIREERKTSKTEKKELVRQKVRVASQKPNGERWRQVRIEN